MTVVGNVRTTLDAASLATAASSCSGVLNVKVLPTNTPVENSAAVGVVSKPNGPAPVALTEIAARLQGTRLAKEAITRQRSLFIGDLVLAGIASCSFGC